MSKPKSRTPSGAAKPAPQPASASSSAVDRKPSQTKFYNGPTVPAPSASKVAIRRPAPKKARRVGIIALVMSLPLLLFASLFSTVLCPPSVSNPSIFSRMALRPLGLDKAPSPLHETLCYPANVYHREVLEPYVYPALFDVQDKIVNHPGVVRLQPVIAKASDKAKPVVDRTVRGARKFYIYYIQPHVPFFQAKLNEATAPVSRLFATHISPHLNVAKGYATKASDSVFQAYSQVASHPLTKTAAVHANKGYSLGKEKGTQLYVWSKPHAITAYNHSERVLRETVIPQVVRILELVFDRISKAQAAAKQEITKLYLAHLHPHLAPHLTKIEVALSPYTATFMKQVYVPYLAPLFNALPPPPPPKTFFGMIADKLPLGGSVVESRGSNLYDRKAEPEKAKTVTKSKSKTAVPEKKTVDPVKQKAAKAEIDATIDSLKTKVEQQGKRGLEKLEEDVASSRSTFLEKLPQLASTGRTSLDREIEHLLTGLNKLYTTSPSLTRDQVSESSQMSESKIKQLLAKVKTSLDSKHSAFIEKAVPGVTRAKADVMSALTNYNELANKLSAAGASQKDWDRYHALKSDAEAWQAKYDKITSSRIKKLESDIQKVVAESMTEFDDISEGFRARLGLLRRSALDRIDAMEDAKSSSSAASSKSAASKSSSSSSSSSTASEPTFSILPIAEAGAALAAGNAVIGKSKEQIVEALGKIVPAASSPDNLASSASSVYSSASAAVHDATRSALKAVGASPTPETPSEHLESIANVVAQGYASVAGVVGDSVHDATRSAIRAVGATPSPESLGEHAQAIYAAAPEVAQSLASVASEAVHDATRSAIKAVGATPSPESLGEHAESVIAVASESAGSLASAASSVIHDATRSVISAVGATPSPESLGEHAESLAAVASESAESLVAAASSLVHDATRSAMKAVGATPSPESVGEYAEAAYAVASESAESLASAASSVAHDATRSAMRAVGATPSPESVNEYIEAGIAAGSSLADNAASSASSVSSAAADVIHDATRSALKAVGVTPSPESAEEYVKSVASEISATGSSLVSAASEAVHDATRSAMKAVGVSPTPESVQEHAESVASVVSSSASSFASSVSSVVSSVASEASATASSLAAEGYDSASSIVDDAYTSGSSVVHDATRAAIRAVGATPSPESLGEYVEQAQAKVASVGQQAESVVREQASTVLSGVAAVTDKVKHAHGGEL